MPAVTGVWGPHVWDVNVWGGNVWSPGSGVVTPPPPPPSSSSPGPSGGGGGFSVSREYREKFKRYLEDALEAAPRVVAAAPRAVTPQAMARAARAIPEQSIALPASVAPSSVPQATPSPWDTPKKTRGAPAWKK